MTSTFQTEIFTNCKDKHHFRTCESPAAVAIEKKPEKKANLLRKWFSTTDNSNTHTENTPPITLKFNGIYEDSDSDAEEFAGRKLKKSLSTMSRGNSAKSSRESTFKKGFLQQQQHIKDDLLMHSAGESKSMFASLPRNDRRIPSVIINSDSDSENEYDGSQPQLRRKSTSAIFKDLLHKAKKNHSTSSSNKSLDSSNSSDDESHPSSPSSSVGDDFSENLFKGLILGSKYKKTSKESSSSSINLSSLELGSPIIGDPKMVRSSSETSLAEKYGKKESLIGKGGHAMVHLCCPLNSSKKFAVKEFRERKKDETQKSYVKKMIAEFCISSSLDNLHVVKTLDLIQDEKHKWCVVMEFCSGGDLFQRIHEGSLTDANEINCYFKQLVLGVKYLHSMGVAHKDLKPENLILDGSRRILKITDFGVSEVFRAPFASVCQKAKGRCGSGPYIAPEEFLQVEYDSQKVDIWAIGIIYYVMAFNSLPWKIAQKTTDHRFEKYCNEYKQYWPFNRYHPLLKSLMYNIMNPDPEKRYSITDIAGDNWFTEIRVCSDDNGDMIECCNHKHLIKNKDHH